MDFIIVTHIPRRQGFLGPIPEKNIIEESQSDSVEAVKDGLHVPLDGYCLIVEKEQVHKVESRIVNELT